MRELDLGSRVEVSQWQAILKEWFRANGREYPWRLTDDPYAILVSELMLQQTQIKTVLDRRYFENWMEQFPTIEALALASEPQILKAWEGLGYYRRARNLHKAAVMMSESGGFPTDLDKILELPGVGRYTAGAVFSFAYNLPAPIVDGNIVRVLARVFRFDQAVDSGAGKKQIWDWADTLTPTKNVRDYNSAIMELGQQVCTKSKPKCSICPVFDFCRSAGLPEVESIPMKARKTNITKQQEHVLLWVKNNKVLLCKETGPQRTGLYKLPAFEMGMGVGRGREVGRLSYHITRYKVEMIVFSPDSSESLEDRVEGEWFELESELPATASPYLKAISKFKNLCSL